MEQMIEVEREETREEEGGVDLEDGLENVEDTDGDVESGEDEDYSLQFKGVVDKFNFIQEGDQDDIELYQQFERLEYETLAERKRKALQLLPCDGKAKKHKKDELLGVTMDEIEDMMSFGCRRRARAAKKRGRKKGLRNKLSPEVNIKIGDATLLYADGNYKEAIPILEEAVQLAPNLPDSYYILCLIYDAMNDRKRALDFLMISAHLSPKDVSLWKKLVAWSIEQRNFGQIKYCLTKAIAADPKDIGLRFDRALLFFEFAEYQKAAESYDQITSIYPANAEARKMSAKMYRKCGQLEKGIGILEKYVNDYPAEADISVLDLLISLYMEKGSYNNAVKLIEKALLSSDSDKKLPLFMKAREAICRAHLGNVDIIEDLLQDLQVGHFEDHYELVKEVADTFLTLGHYSYALKLYFIILGRTVGNEKALISKFSSISTRKVSNALTTLTGNKSIVAMCDYGGYHKMVKKYVISAILGTNPQKRNRHHRDIMIENVASILSSKIEGKDYSLVELRQPFQSELFRLALKQSLGKDIESVFVKEFGVTMTIKEILQILVIDPMMGIIEVDWRDFFPYLKWISNKALEMKIQHMEDRKRAVIKTLIEEKKRHITSENEVKSYLDYLLLEKDTLTEEQIIALIWESIIESSDTTLVTTEWAMYELAKNPTCQDRLYLEIKSVCGSTQITEEHLPYLPYLNAVFHETLRFHSPLPIVPPRHVHEDTQLRGYNIPAGTEIIINLYACNMNKEDWEEAEAWKPERFLSEHYEQMGMHKTMAFGGGKRACAGTLQAMLISCTTIGRLIQEFQWKLKDGEEENIDTVRLTNLKLFPMQAYIKRREEDDLVRQYA